MKKYKIKLLSTFFIALFFIVGCAQTISERKVTNSQEVQEKWKEPRLVAMKSMQDDGNSQFYKLHLQQQGISYKATRYTKTISFYHYPYSGVRKVDEILLGVIGTPFTPLAMIGGIINGEPDLFLFPFSALNPFENFRPQKSGLLTGAVTPDVTVKELKSPWKYGKPVKKNQTLVVTEAIVKAGESEILIATDPYGVATLDLLQIPQIQSATSDIEVIISKEDLECSHIIKRERFLHLQGKKILSPLILKKQPSKKKSPPKKEQPPVANKVVPAPKPLPSQQERLFLFKGLTHGYWIKKRDGFPIMALPANSQVEVYNNKKLELAKAITLTPGKEFYVFEFAFKNKGENAAVKIGDTPLEKDAYGWVKAEDVYLWNTLYRLKTSGKLTIYPSYKDSLQKNAKTATAYTPAQSSYFPVLEKKGDYWCIAYPRDENNWEYGWIYWHSQEGIEVEVRAMKHRLDLAIRYLERHLLLEQNKNQIQSEFTEKLQGPLSMVRAKEQMLLSALSKEKESKEIISSLLLNLPKNKEEQKRFVEETMDLGDILTQDLQKSGDIIYIPAKRNK